MALTKINTKLIANNTIALTNIADNAVDATKIASNSILTRHIDDDQITADQIVDDIALAGNISTTGNFGVGAAPTNGGISTAASPVLSISGTVPELNFVDTSSSANDYWIRVSDGLQFGEASDSRMYLANGGNLGIGTTSPGSKLSVVGPTAASSPYTSDCIEIAPANHTTRTWELRYDDGGAVGNGFSISAAHTRILYLNANGTVGIGTASPSAKLDVVTNDNVYAAEFTQSNTANGDGVFISVGSTASADYALTVRSDAGNTSVLAAKADGKVGIGTFTPAKTLDVSGEIRASTGILFGSDTAAANTLDDYEEGTFTPSWTVAGGGSVSGVTSTNVGTYTKIGNMVFVTVRSHYVQTTGTVPTSYSMTLPFQAKNTGGMAGSGIGSEPGQTGKSMFVNIDGNGTTCTVKAENGSAPPANAYMDLFFSYVAG